MQQLSLYDLVTLAAIVSLDALVTFKSDGYAPDGVECRTGLDATFGSQAGALSFEEFRDVIEPAFDVSAEDDVLKSILLSRIPRDPERTIPIPLVGFEYRVDGSLPSLVLIEQGEG